MSYINITNSDSNAVQKQLNITMSTTGNDPRTKGDVDGEDSEMNLFLSDESSGNDIEREMDETSGETSGETSKKSLGSVSTTEAWFREFNQNTEALNKNNIDDDDDSEAPYYINSYKTHPKPVSNQQSSIISRQYHAHGHRIQPISKSPRHGNFLKKRGESSGSDSYRSVIDDLTLKNQKLRQKLRKIERIHSKSLHKEKLFEVRYYQMPREKRHELEEYLRQFAAQLSSPDSSLTQKSNDSTMEHVNPDSHIKASDKSKMKQVVRAIENVFTTKPPLDDHYLKDQEDADPKGYVYLNLLTNMAQLHTMSVTLPFVKQAIRTFSNYLELNEDGTKVRWRTGLDHIKPCQFSTNKNKDVDTIGSEGSGVSEIGSSGDKQSDFSPSNPSSSDQKNSANAYITPSSLTSSNTSKPINQHIKSTPSISHYRPVFLHRNVSSSSSSSDESSSINDQHDGPVIYYEGGLFCTDFSRDVIMDDDDKPTSSRPLLELDNSILDDDNMRWNVPRYERATNFIFGGNNMLNKTSEEDSNSGQEADDESPIKLCDNCGANNHDLLVCPLMSVIAIDDRNESSNDGLKKILMEKEIEFTLDKPQSNSPSEKNYYKINYWNDNVSKNSLQSLPLANNSKQYLPDYKKLHTTKTPGVTTEDNFVVLVQTSHPLKGKISHSKESSVDSDVTLMSSSNSSNITVIKQQNENPPPSQNLHKIISTKLFQLPPSMSPQPRTSTPPGFERTSIGTSSKATTSDSGGSSGYGSSSSFSESPSIDLRDNSYLLRNNTLLQLSRSNNSNCRDLKSSQEDEIQDMELDSLSSDSSDLSPFINIDADEDDEDEEMKFKDDVNHHHKSRIVESKLGMDLRLQETVIEERRKLVDKAAPQEQRYRLLNDIMSSSRAMIQALGDNKTDNDVIDNGMDSLPTIPLPFFNQQFNFPERNAQQPDLGINNLGIHQNNNNKQ